MRLLLLAALLLVAALTPLRAEELSERRVEVATPRGVQQPFWLALPPGRPVAALMLFTGSQGALSVPWGPPDLRKGNFLVRSRGLLVAAGFATAVIDVPSDRPILDDNFRTGTDHRADMAAVVAWLRQELKVPVWVVGTSRGTLSAANAATLPEGGPDGLVLTSSLVERTGKRSGYGIVQDLPLARIAIPTLVVHNVDDACHATPFRTAKGLLGELDRAPRKELITVAGGDPPISDPCEALSRHGYIGIEAEVVGIMARWIRGS